MECRQFSQIMKHRSKGSGIYPEHVSSPDEKCHCRRRNPFESPDGASCGPRGLAPAGGEGGQPSLALSSLHWRCRSARCGSRSPRRPLACLSERSWPLTRGSCNTRVCRECAATSKHHLRSNEQQPVGVQQLTATLVITRSLSRRLHEKPLSTIY